jgi:hypothetical protein
MPNIHELLEYGYTQDSQFGLYYRKDHKGNLHTFMMNDEVDGEWIYTKYNSRNRAVHQSIFIP